MISIGLVLAGILVSALVALLFARSGSSLRPIAWFFGFFMLVALPQFFGQLWLARRAWVHDAPRRAAFEQLASSPSAEEIESAVKRLFGSDAESRLVTDARNVFGEVLQSAEVARVAVFPTGESVLIARFKGSTEAEKAWVEYLRLTGLNQLKGVGDSERGYAVTRPSGDRAYALPRGNTLGVWTGPDDATIRRRMVAGGFSVPRRAPLAKAEDSNIRPVSGMSVPVAGGGEMSLRWFLPLFAAYLVIVVLYYFKGSAWAGTQKAALGSAKLSAAELAARLEALSPAEVPFQVQRGSRPGEVLATWRYADAKWADFARARGMRRVFKIRMILDEVHGVVRATDYVASWDGSVGRGGAEFEWKAMMGIVFMQYEHRRVFGFQWDENGRLKPEVSYAYTFNLKELKSPLVETVLKAGWDWRPTVWEGPEWLRWLTR